MHAIIRLEDTHYLIYVLLMGVRKSNLFMVPTIMQGQEITIIIMLFSSLLNNIVK